MAEQFNVYFTNRTEGEHNTDNDFVGPDGELEWIGIVEGPTTERFGGATPFRDQLVALVGGWGVVDSCFRLNGPTYDGVRYLLYYARDIGEGRRFNNEVVLIPRSQS